jgi:HAE1 family hydrophobic/amphiphilic exporter-1
MWNSLYSNPLRVYLLLAICALCGIWAGSKLPVSLFPNVTQPQVEVSFSFQGGMTDSDFRNTYGLALESGLRSIKRENLSATQVVSEYSSWRVNYTVLFNWNADPEEALREVKTFVDSTSASMPTDLRDSRSVWGSAGRSKGFFLATVSSPERSPAEVYALVEPQLKPRTSAFEDGTVSIMNPDSQHVRIQLKPHKMANYGIFPNDIEQAVKNSQSETSGGWLKVGNHSYNLVVPRKSQTLQDLESITFSTPTNSTVRLTDVASVSLVNTMSTIHRTSGQKSVLIFASSKDGGNIKRLSENLKREMENVRALLAPDLQFGILVDPSLYIQNSIRHVVSEVAIGAGLAVVILFLFIGSLRNVLTAAIEIPLSLILALVLMKIFGMNINLVSLGGLALSCGMNVDASVVVLENIFQKFEGVSPSQLSHRERLDRVVAAVKEVVGPIVASTIASLVVFLPIVFTSDLTYAILGDLAKAVIFSHLFSAFIALLLVPTVRLHILASAKRGVAHSHGSPIEGLLTRLEKIYEALLGKLVHGTKATVSLSLLVLMILGILAALILPRLPREIVGKPESDLVGLWARDNKIKTFSEVDSFFNEIENTLKTIANGQCEFTYTQAFEWGGGSVFCRVKDKKRVKEVFALLEKNFKSSPQRSYSVFEWTLAEMPLPNPPDLRFDASGGDPMERLNQLAELSQALIAKFPDVNFNVSGADEAEKTVLMHPREETWKGIAASGSSLTPQTLIRALGQFGRSENKIATLYEEKNSFEIDISANSFSLADFPELRGFPVAVAGNVLPLNALFSFEERKTPSLGKFVNGEPTSGIEGKISKEKRARADEIAREIQTFVERWNEKRGKDQPVTIKPVEADSEVRDAVNQLAVAAGWSVLLIFLTMFLQSGSITESLLVLVAVPLALLGVIVSLFVFKSTLSVNSVLGVILLNGISVANSILLVDCAGQKFKEGCSPVEAVLYAGKRRLRPILITSLTTILGMMPIALGFGDGGKVLQPLGIAVAGGMWLSMLLTIFLVPALHRLFLEHRARISLQQEASA